MLTSQPVIPAKRCRQTARRDLWKLLKSAPAECQEHLKRYYCQLVEDVQSFNTCANLTDEQGLQYFECITQPIQGLQAPRRPFASQCALNNPGSTGKHGKGTKETMPLRLEVPALDFRLAFLILAHRAAENVKRLLQRIYAPNNIFLIHVDLKSPDVKSQLDRFLEGAQLVRAQTFSAVNVTKGGNDLMLASMLGLRRLLKLRPISGEEVPWNYFVKLSEFDYPVAPRYALQQYLWLHKGFNFVGLDGCYASTCSRHLGTACAGATYSFLSTLRMHKPLSFGMRFARGSEWIALTHDFAKYLAVEVDKPSSAMHEVWTDALLLYQPDEVFFQTALLNSPFCQRHVDMILHYIPAVEDRKMHGMDDEIGTRSPAAFSHQDLALLFEGGRTHPRFFARKFLNVSQEPASELCRRLDAMIQERRVSETAPSWKGLLPWLETNFPRWAQIAAPSDSSACSTRGSGDETCQGWGGIELLGRLKPHPSTAKAMAARTPETWLLRGLRASGATETFMLSERFAVPASIPGHASMMGVSLLALRIGTGWARERGQFEGHVNVLPLSSCSARDVHLATYWARHLQTEDVGLQVTTEWIVPGGARCGQVTDVLVSPSLLGGQPVAFGIPQECAGSAKPGTWTCRVRLGSAKLQGKLLASSQFVVYSSFEDLSVVQMHRFFALQALEQLEQDGQGWHVEKA